LHSKAGTFPLYPSGNLTAADIKLAAGYTGGEANHAASGAPVIVGWLNDEADTVAYPENTSGASLAVWLVNRYLGGIKGHPIQLDQCQVNNPGEGASCAQQMVADGVRVVITGTIVDGNAAIYNTLAAARIPVVEGNGFTTTDLAPPGNGTVVDYMPAAAGLILGLAKFIGTSKPGVGLGFAPKSIAAVYTNDSGGTTAFAGLFKLDKYLKGITIHGVSVSPTADASQVQEAVTSSGAAQDSVFVPLTPVAQCVSVYNALKALGIRPTVVTTGLCFGTPLIQALGGTFPKGWYFGDYGVNYFMYDPKVMASRELAVYIAAVHQDNPSMQYTGFAGPSFANILTIARLYNGLGPRATSAQLAKRIVAFQGPQFGLSGPLRCGFERLLPALCGQEMGVAQFSAAGRWVAVEDAYNNKLINGFPGFQP
jgi:branched-chain amino acid transport system substrate-binding protein